MTRDERIKELQASIDRDRRELIKLRCEKVETEQDNYLNKIFKNTSEEEYVYVYNVDSLNTEVHYFRLGGVITGDKIYISSNKSYAGIDYFKSRYVESTFGDFEAFFNEFIFNLAHRINKILNKITNKINV